MGEITKPQHSATYNPRFSCLGWEWWIDGDSVLWYAHTPRTNPSPWPLPHGPRGRGLLPWAVGMAGPGLQVGPHVGWLHLWFCFLGDVSVWNPLQPQGVTLLTSCFFLCLIVHTSSPRLLCLALPVSKACYCWGRGSHHHTVSHPKCVTKCEFRNICLIKFIFCFFLFQFMPV